MKQNHNKHAGQVSPKIILLFVALSIFLGTLVYFVSDKIIVWRKEKFVAPCLRPGSLLPAKGSLTIWGKNLSFPDKSYFVPVSENYQTSFDRLWHPLGPKASPQNTWRVSGEKTIRLINDVGYFFRKNYDNTKFIVGDMYDGGNWHIDHSSLYSLDLYSEPGSPLFETQTIFKTSSNGTREIDSQTQNKSYSRLKTEALAKTLIQTGNIEYILYSDSKVITDIGKWAEENGYKTKTGEPIMRYYPDLFDHFHVQILSDTAYCGLK